MVEKIKKRKRMENRKRAGAGTLVSGYNSHMPLERPKNIPSVPLSFLLFVCRWVEVLPDTRDIGKRIATITSTIEDDASEETS